STDLLPARSVPTGDVAEGPVPSRRDQLAVVDGERGNEGARARAERVPRGSVPRRDAARGRGAGEREAAADDEHRGSWSGAGGVPRDGRHSRIADAWERVHRAP